MRSKALALFAMLLLSIGALAQSPVFGPTFGPGTGSSSSPTGTTLLFESTVTAAAELDVITRTAPASGAIFQSDYDNYQCVVSGFHNVANSGGVPVIQFSTNGGSTWDTGGNYGWAQQWWQTNGTTGDQRWGAVSNGIVIFGNTGFTSGPDVSGTPLGATFTVYTPNAAVAVTVRGSGIAQSTNNYLFEMGGFEATTVARNAMRIVPEQGATFTFSGTLRCYGIAK